VKSFPFHEEKKAMKEKKERKEKMLFKLPAAHQFHQSQMRIIIK